MGYEYATESPPAMLRREAKAVSYLIVAFYTVVESASPASKLVFGDHPTSAVNHWSERTVFAASQRRPSTWRPQGHSALFIPKSLIEINNITGS